MKNYVQPALELIELDSFDILCALNSGGKQDANNTGYIKSYQDFFNQSNAYF